MCSGFGASSQRRKCERPYARYTWSRHPHEHFCCSWGLSNVRCCLRIPSRIWLAWRSLPGCPSGKLDSLLAETSGGDLLAFLSRRKREARFLRNRFYRRSAKYWREEVHSSMHRPPGPNGNWKGSNYAWCSGNRREDHCPRVVSGTFPLQTEW